MSSDPPDNVSNRSPAKEITGVLERITFAGEESGFVIARLQQKEEPDLTTVVGSLGGVPVGSTLRLTGHWVKDSRYGWQFKVAQCHMLRPNTLNGIQRYLGSGLVKGIGPAFAARIVAAFGLDTLDVLDREPERLLEVAGLGRKRADSIRSAWAEQRQLHEIMVFLQGYGISSTFAIRIFKRYGVTSLKVVRDNPFQLAEDIRGIGFKSADAIAASLGIAGNDPRRLRAGVLFVLHEATGEGHVFLPETDLVTRAADMLAGEKKQVAAVLPSLLEDEKLVRDADVVYLAPLFYAEKGAADALAALAMNVPATAVIQAGQAVDWAEKRMKLTLGPGQKEALFAALANKVAIITGGPGTGKTTVLNGLLMIYKAKGLMVALASPTGRAAKRLAEATGQEAKTIHRLLEFDPGAGGFRRGRSNPLCCDVLIVDEVSMLDVLLANSLFRALPRSASLVLVGDADQLPSVGPGNVLADVIQAKSIAVVRLEQIYRQSEGSLISINAARVNRGETLELLPSYRGDKDFYCIFREDADGIATEIVSLVSQRLPKKYGFHPVRQIQVLTPMRRGLAGTVNLNMELQKALNTKAAQQGDHGRFFPGDKVMQLVNNYDKELFNGDMGLVVAFDQEERLLTVDFDGRQVALEGAELFDLTLAYACTVHKSQGAEFPCVVVALHSSHYPLLERNLLYTALTRGKKLVVLVCNKKGLAVAIRTRKIHRRHSRLRERLAALMA